jgi:nucleoside-diphosphate-sugar epimerase
MAYYQTNNSSLMSITRNIIITGASGMIGSHLLQTCLDSKETNNIYLLSRKPSVYQNSRIKEIIISDFQDHNALSCITEKIDVVFFCIGVYTGAVDKNTFRQITVDYPVALGMDIISRWPSCKFILLSGAGADRSEKSNVLFAQYKGAAENKLYQIFHHNFHSARPGYIYPVVKRQEPNFMYRLFRIAYPLIKLMGKKYSITSVQLAKALFVLGMRDQHQTTFENEELVLLAENMGQ